MTLSPSRTTAIPASKWRKDVADCLALGCLLNHAYRPSQGEEALMREFGYWDDHGLTVAGDEAGADAAGWME